MRNIKWLLGIVFSVVLGALIFNGAGAVDEEAAVLAPKNIERLTKIIGEIKKYYYKSVDSSLLFEKAISGMLVGLDPHSDYLDADALRDLDMVAFGKFSGIGVEVYPEQGTIKVISPIDDTPAYKAGIKAGDYIVQIDNKLVREMTLMDAVRMMRGPKGSKLSLTIIRKNKHKPLVFNLHRDTIKIKTVKDRMLEPGYGYVRLSWFEESVERDMVRAIRRMKTSSAGGLKGLVLDLRSNPGGLVESAIRIADDFLGDEFLKDNKVIMSFKGQGEEIQATASSGKDILPNVPIVVLVNEGTASASEIVAGALQDHKRAIIVGERTFGKGTMQTVIHIDKNSAIKLTTALYYTPLGRSIQAKGIEPDIEVGSMRVLRDDQDEQNIPRVDESALIDHVKNNGDNDTGSIASKFGKKEEKQLKPDPELIYKDYQLYEALHILKGQNVVRERS